MLVTRLVQVSLFAAVLSALTACGGSPPPRTVVADDPPPPPPPRSPVHLSGDRDVHGTIGPAGGSITLGNGFRIDIPEGALTEDILFEADIGAEANVWSSEEGEVEAGPLYDLRPFVIAASGHPFTVSCDAIRPPSGFESAEVVLGMEEEMERRAFTDAVQTRWQYHPATREGDRFSATVAYFGGHRLQFGLIRPM